MLCSLRNSKPHKELNKILLRLAYTLIGLTFVIGLSLVYSEYSQYFVFLVLFLLMVSIYFSIKTIRASEQAITYGGFANEMLSNSQKIERIDGSDGFPVLQNNMSELLFKNQHILVFLADNIINNPNNRVALQRLEQAVTNLIKTKVSISLDLNKDSANFFEAEEWFDIEFRPIYLKQENIFEKPFSIAEIEKETYLFWSFSNVTAKKAMETVFYEEKNYLHDFLDDLPTGVYTCNSKYEIEYCNNAFANMLGMTRENILQMSLQELMVDEKELPPKTASWQGRIFLKKENGSSLNVYISQENFRDKGNIKIRSVVFDQLPTEAKIQEELNQSLDKLSWLFTSSPIGVLFINNKLEVVDSNKPAQSFLLEDEQTINHQNICNFICDEDVELFRQEIVVDKYPKKIDLEMKIGKTKKNVTLFITKMIDLYSKSAEKEKGWVLYVADITEQKNLEIQYAQAQKMQAMGQLAGGVAHDFNNLLTAIIGFSDLLLQRHGVGDPSFADLMQIKQNSNRAAGLVRQLLAFSRKQALQPKLINVTENFLELNHMLKRILGENININFHHNDNLGFIKVDPVQFSQVILNLAVNAKDAMSNRGDLNISTAIEDLTEPYIFGEDTISPGEFVVINVSDTGSGISEENLTRIFEPFFSTKQNVVGSGTGLGLAMVYGIVRQTGGFIKVDSKLDKGTTFSIYLPRFEQNDEVEVIENKTKNKGNNSSATSISLSQKPILGMNISKIDSSIESADFDTSKFKVLFVDDEASVRAFAIRALRKKGYNVIDCDSAENALERIEEAKDFDLLITDMVMPGISGAELSKIAKEKMPNIKIVLASGYSEEMARKELPNNADINFMSKPFSLGDLINKTAEILQS